MSSLQSAPSGVPIVGLETTTIYGTHFSAPSAELRPELSSRFA